MELPDNFPDRIRLLRKHRNLNQKDLAARVGMTPQTLNDLERGRRRKLPEPEVIERLARELQVSPAFLLFGPAGRSGKSDSPKIPDRPETTVNEPAPMVYPAYERPPPEPTEEDCRRYFDKYLRGMRSVPGGMGHTWVQLRLHFPLQRIDGLSGQEEDE